jgi:hypothetical protein
MRQDLLNWNIPLSKKEPNMQKILFPLATVLTLMLFMSCAKKADVTVPAGWKMDKQKNAYVFALTDEEITRGKAAVETGFQLWRKDPLETAKVAMVDFGAIVNFKDPDNVVKESDLVYVFPDLSKTYRVKLEQREGVHFASEMRITETPPIKKRSE